MQPTRDEARRLLGVPPTATPVEVKRAYRRLAREHHPDQGGDAATFHRIQLAYERLGGEPPRASTVARGRPSRSGPTRDVTTADVGSVVWDGDGLRDGEPLSRDAVARWLATRGHGLRAASRAPGSRLNRYAASLATDLTSALSIDRRQDDRGRAVVALEVRAGPRRARRVLDGARLEGAWLRSRGSSSTTLRTAVTTVPDPRLTAVGVVDHLEALLDALAWPLEAWRCIDPAA